MSSLSESEGEIEIDISNIVDLLGKDSRIIIVSGNKYNFGTITNCSLSTCSLFGYTKDEIIGQNLNMLIPDIMQKTHTKILEKKTSNSKINHSAINSFNFYKEIKSFGITNAKYLIPLHMRIAFLITEQDQNYFICDIIMDQSRDIDENEVTSYVLANRNFIIQNFTPNSEKMLNLHSNHLNGGLDITYCIKEFKEQYLRCVLEKTNVDKAHLLDMKRDILQNTFTGSSIVTWKNTIFSQSESSFGFLSKTKKPIASSLKNLKINVLDEKDEQEKPLPSNQSYIMSYDEIEMMGKKIGYVFRFELIRKYFFVSQGSQKMSSKLGMKKLRVSPKSAKNLHHPRNYDKITNDFVPKNNGYNVYIDITDFSYKIKGNNTTHTKYTEHIKKAALDKIDKINNINKKKTEISSDDECSYSLISESSNTETETFNSLDETHQNTNENNLTQDKTNYIDMYYKINLSNIKLLQYNYSSKTTAEIKGLEKISQMEKIIREERQKIKKKVETNQAYTKQVTLVKDKIIDGHNSYTASEFTPDFDEINLSKDLLKTQINYFLNKKDSHSSVLLLKAVALLILIAVFLEITGYGLYIIISISKGFDFLEMIKGSTTFFSKMLMAVYHVRELTLLGNENYTNIYDSNRTRYILNHTQSLLKIYEDMYKAQYIIQKHESIVSEDTFYQLNNCTTMNEVLFASEYKQTIKVSRSTSLSLLQSAIFRISNNNITEMSPLNSDVFFVISNSLNANFIICMNQVEYFITDFLNHFQNQNILSLIYSILFWVTTIIFLKIFQVIFNKVIYKRESYLQVFYDIDDMTISYSLHNCESFLLLLNSKKQLYSESQSSESSSIQKSSPEEKNEIKQKKK